MFLTYKLYQEKHEEYDFHIKKSKKNDYYTLNKEDFFIEDGICRIFGKKLQLEDIKCCLLHIYVIDNDIYGNKISDMAFDTIDVLLEFGKTLHKNYLILIDYKKNK